jgi:hypothetical protein
MNQAQTALALLLATGLTAGLSAQTFDEHFEDRTLRVDYVMTGDAMHQQISLDALASLPTWAGRRQKLSELPLRGNATLTVRSEEGAVLYRTSACTLFQEWQETDEAQHLTRSFETTLLLPYPKHPVEVEMLLLNARGDTTAQLQHRVDPTDILIRRKGELAEARTPYRYIVQNGDPAHCIDVAIVAEGYTEGEMEQFYADAQTAAESLFDHAPFSELRDRFNIVAVAAPSRDSGVSVPRLNDWRETAFGAHFSTFYSDRYLTTTNIQALHDALAGIPYEHIIVLANTEEYGGGGIYNFYTLTAAHHKMFRPVVVHEFGHSFGGLTDEYYYEDDVILASYPTDVEPWEPNITSLVDFDAKWADMVAPKTAIPTRPDTVRGRVRMPEVGAYEGGGYFAKGIYRPSYDCRMRTNQCARFCPVCERSLRRLIEFYTE